MESKPTPPPTQITSPDSSLEDAPLLQLLGAQMHEMTAEELRERVTKLREVTSSPISLKQSLSNKKAETKTARATAPKASSADLTNKYLNLGKKGMA